MKNGFQIHGKISFALEKFPEILETFSTIYIHSFIKKQLSKTQNILDGLEKLPVLWKSFHSSGNISEVTENLPDIKN